MTPPRGWKYYVIFVQRSEIDQSILPIREILALQWYENKTALFSCFDFCAPFKPGKSAASTKSRKRAPFWD